MLGSPDDPLGLACVRVKNLPLVPFGLALVDYGPICREGDIFDPVRFRGCLQALIKEYVSRRSLVLRINPPPLVSVAAMQSQLETLTDLGFLPGGRDAHRTIFVDIRPDIQTLRRGLHQKWRNGLTRAEASAISVDLTDDAGWEKFGALFHEMARRKGFSVSQGPEFFREVQKESGTDEQLALIVASEAGTITAAHLGSYVGNTATYLLGVSDMRARKTFASYRLQWAAIEHAQRRGIEWYDLGGVDPVANPDGYLFKKRMGGTEVVENGYLELSPGGLAKALVHGAEGAQRIHGAIRTRISTPVTAKAQGQEI